jgi:hypothetical protein
MFQEAYNLQSKGKRKRKKEKDLPVYTITFFDIEQLFHGNKSSMIFTMTK